MFYWHTHQRKITFIKNKPNKLMLPEDERDPETNWFLDPKTYYNPGFLSNPRFQKTDSI